jgi:hypothetical protein
MAVRQKVSGIHVLGTELMHTSLGLGLYWKAIAQELVGKHDLHETWRLLASLDEYDHLLRILRLCTSHIFRNTKKAAVSEIVRNLMRSLVCIEHSDWDTAIRRIQVEGGTAGASISLLLGSSF